MWASGGHRRLGSISPLPLVLVVLSITTLLLFFTSKRLIDQAEQFERLESAALPFTEVRWQHGMTPEAGASTTTTTNADGGASAEKEILQRLESRAKREEPSKSPEHRLIICAKIGNEISYLPEWIEFHRIQGFTKFILYVDDVPTEHVRRVMTNQVVALRDLYEEVGDVGLIDIYPLTPLFETEISNILDPSQYAKATTPLHRLSQQSLLKHCWEHYRLEAEWIAHIDVDEFVYAPKFPSITEFMKSLYSVDVKHEIPGSLMPAYQFGNLSGTYLWPVNYGMGTDSVLTPRVAVRASPARGESQLLFDPGYHNARNTQEAEQEVARLQTLLSWLADVQGNVDVLSEKSVRNFFEGLLAQETRRHNHYGLFDSYLDKSLAGGTLKDMKALFDRYYEKAAEDFFLTIDSHRYRMTNVDYGDSYDTVAESMIKLYPYCADYVNELRKSENTNLRPKIAKHQREAKLGPPEHIECVPGEMPPQITNVGKTFFWTGNRFDPPSAWSHEQAYPSNRHHRQHRRRPLHQQVFDDDSTKPEMCVLPWVHHCAHKSWAPVILADMHEQLRLDHHMARSVESRTIGDSEWRVLQGKLGKFVNHKNRLDFSVLQFVSAFRDDSKARFIPELRKRLARLRPTPMHSSVTLPENHLKYETAWEHTSCQLIDLLRRKQSMCPATHHFVGVLGHLIPPPIGLQPYGFCTNKLGAFSFKYARSSLNDEHLQSCISDYQAHRCSSIMQFMHADFETADIALCEGWPRTSCCNEDSEMRSIMTDVFHRFNIHDEYDKASSRNLTLAEWQRMSLMNMKGQY